MKKIFLLLFVFLVPNLGLRAKLLPSFELPKENATVAGTDPPQISLMYQIATGFRANIFDNHTDETNYEFEYKIGNGSWITGLNYGPYAGTSIKTISIPFTPPTGTYGITGRLRAKFVISGTTSYSDYSTVYYFVFSTDLPLNPLSFGLAPLSETTVNMSWKSNGTNTTHYVIDRADANLNYRQHKIVNANTLQFTDEGLMHNSFYSYRIKGCNTVGCSEYTYGDTRTLNGTPISPSASIGLAGISPNHILIGWGDRSINETNFILQRADINGVYVTIATLPSNTVSYNDYNVSPNTRYFYRAAASNNFATSTFTNLGDQTTPTGIPNKPGTTGLLALGATKTMIAWTDKSIDESHFLLQRADNNGVYVTIAKLIANSTNYFDSGLAPNTRYFYRVASTNNFGTSDYLQIGDVTTLTGNPLNLTASAGSPIVVNLAWTDNSDDETGFEIQRADSNLVYKKLTSVESNVTSYNDLNVNENTRYFYRVFALFGNYSSGFSETNTKTPSKIPSSPSNAVAEALAFNQVKVMWKDNSTDEASFEIERAISGGKFEKIGSVAKDSTSYLDTQAIENTSYIYQVKALSTFGESNFVQSNVVKTPIEKVLSPTGFVASTKVHNIVNLIWASSAKNVLNFEIERSNDSTTFISIAKVDSSLRSYNDSTAMENSKYFYRIYTIGKLANSEFTNSNSVMTPIQPVSEVMNFMAEVRAFDHIHLMWEDKSKNVTSYQIERKTAEGAFELIATLKNGVMMYVDSSLKENTVYSYRIKSIGKLDSSDFVGSTTVKTPFQPVKKPSNLTASAKAFNEVVITWTDNASNETAYVLQKSFDGVNYTNIDLPANSTTYTDKAVLDNSTYSYKLFAKNENVISDTTAIASTKTPLKPLNPPTNLTLKALSDNEIALTWQDNEGLETGFDIERSKDGINFSKIASVNSNVITFLNVNLDASTKYYYRVRAINEKQSSIYSNIAEISTLVTTAIGKEKLNGTIKVYPNPTSDFVTVDYPVGTYSVELVSAFGLSISTRNVELNSISTEINLTGLPSGIYFVSANSKSNKLTKKIIKN